MEQGNGVQDRSGQDKDCFFKDHQIINLKLQKTFPYRKTIGQLCLFCSFMPYYAGNKKKPAYYRLFSQVLLPKLRSFKSKKDLKTF